MVHKLSDPLHLDLEKYGNKKIIEKTEALIDALRATCSAYGLSGDSSQV